MKYSVILTAIALAAVLVEAAPHKGKGKAAKGKGKKHHKGKGKGAAAAAAAGGAAGVAAGAAAGGAAAGNAVGAAFFINNEPTGNMVIVNKVASDGTLTFAGGVATGGNGAHGVTNPVGPDALFSQGAVKVLGNMLFAVNAGSNSVSAFNIDMNSENVLTMVGKPVASGGDFPMSLAVSSTANMVCALNGGANSGVACFKPDPTNGLTAVDNTVRPIPLNQTTPPAGPAGTASHAIFSNDGKTLIASLKGTPPTPGFLATFDVAADGSLSQNFSSTTPGNGALLPFGMVAIPGSTTIVGTDAATGFDVFADAKTKGVATPLNGAVALCWATFSPKTGSVFGTDIGTSLVTEVSVNGNMSTKVLSQTPQGNGTATIDLEVASIGSNDFMYVLAANASTIMVNSVDAPGKISNVQKFNVGTAAKAANVTINPFNIQGMTLFMTSSAAATAGNATAVTSNSTVVAPDTDGNATAVATETLVAGASSTSASDASGAGNAAGDSAAAGSAQ